MAFFVIHIACAPTVLSRSLNTIVMASSSYSRDQVLSFIEDWSDSSNDGMSSGEEEYLDRELEGGDEDFR